MKTILAIIGPPFTGSTVIQYVLNTHPQIAGFGEIYHCEDKYYHTEGNVKVGCSTCEGKCPVFYDLPWPISKIYSTLMDRTDAAVIVDSSKSISWYKKLLDRGVLNKYQVKFLWLCREPLSWAQSNIKELGGTVENALLSWSDGNEAIENFLRGRDYKAIGYPKFSNPIQAFKEILSWLGLVYLRPPIDSYWETKIHQVGGNTAAFYGNKPFKIRTTMSLPYVPTVEAEKALATYNRIFR